MTPRSRSSFDAIVIGGGHNGLVAAVALARAGHSVCVVEKRPTLGGLCAPLRFGKERAFMVPGILHDEGLLRAQVVEALGLQEFGLKLRPAPTRFAAGDSGGVMLDATGSTLSESDRSAYSQWRGFLDRLAPFVRRFLCTPPPPLLPQDAAGLMNLLGKGVSLRRLGRDDMVELMRVAPMCAADWLQERFASQALCAMLAGPSITGEQVGPWSAGTAATLLFKECAADRFIAGGPAALADALQAALGQAGGQAQTNAEVSAITVDDAGAANGVTLRDGTHLSAQAVLSAMEPARTLLQLIDPALLRAGTERDLVNYRTRGVTAKVHLAVRGALHFDAFGDMEVEHLQVGDSVEALERAHDAVKYRHLSQAPHLDVRIFRGPPFAPPEHAVLSALVNFAPYRLDGGWSDEVKERVLANTITQLSTVSAGFSERVVAAEVFSPVDLEQEYGLSGGHLHHGEHGLDQLAMMRPTPELARYQTPIPKLFLCGSGSHPGGGVTGMPGLLGAATARRSL